MPFTPLSCGNCGGRKVTLRAKKAPGLDRWTRLRARCVKCKSVTVVLLETTMRLDWGKNAEGILHG